MTDQEINLAIDEACGKCVHPPESVKSWYQDPPVEYYEGIRCRKCNCTPTTPNYVEDLNAMHEAENLILPDDFQKFVQALSGVINSEHCYEVENHFRRIHATAHQRAEAFLRTIGKWKV